MEYREGLPRLSIAAYIIVTFCGALGGFSADAAVCSTSHVSLIILKESAYGLMSLNNLSRSSSNCGLHVLRVALLFIRPSIASSVFKK